ncbi:hypothetical protein J4456_02275 [Candidatus Pacearchaeota archaeon]|nr:hypothetical protein [Candidatus Pacearchaeota archaeon]
MKTEKRDDTFTLRDIDLILDTRNYYEFLTQYNWTSLSDGFIHQHFTPQDRDEGCYCQHYLSIYSKTFTQEKYDLNAIDIAVKRLMDSFPPTEL